MQVSLERQALMYTKSRTVSVLVAMVFFSSHWEAFIVSPRKEPHIFFYYFYKYPSIHH